MKNMGSMYTAWDRNIFLAGEFTQDIDGKDIVSKLDDNEKWCLDPLSCIVFFMRVAKLRLKQIMSEESVFLPVAAKKDVVQSWFSWDTTLMLREFYVLTWRVKTSTFPWAG